METVLIIIHVIVCLELIVVVLLQAGKGAGLGSLFGGGSETVFGTQGGNILTKITTGSAIVFMITSLSLSYISTEGSSKIKDFEGSPGVKKNVPKQPSPPAQQPEQTAVEEKNNVKKEVPPDNNKPAGKPVTTPVSQDKKESKTESAKPPAE